MTFLTMLTFEIKKLFKRRSAHAGIIIIGLVTIALSVLTWISRPAETYSGVSLILDTLHFHNNVLFTFPLVAVLLAVQSFSEELSTGTLRTVVTKPVRRENVLVSKAVALFLYMLCALYLQMVITLLIGLRWGYYEGFASFVPRLLFIYFEYALGSMVLVAFTFIAASLVVNPVMTALISLGFHKLLFVIESFSQIRNYTVSYHISTSFQMLTGRSVDFRQLYQSLAVVLIYILAFLLIASFIWERRERTA